MFAVRFILPLLLTLGTLSAIASKLAEYQMLHWVYRDVELRSELIFRSVDDTLTDMWNEQKKPESYKRLFDNISRDEKVLAAGLCSANRDLLVKSTQWPPGYGCPKKLASDKPVFDFIELPQGIVFLGSFPLATSKFPQPYFVVMHDLSFGEHRAYETKLYLIAFLTIVTFVSAIITILIARFTLRNWLGRLHLTMRDPHQPWTDQRLPREFIPVIRSMRQLLRDVKPGNQLNGIKIGWTPTTLKSLLAQELPKAEVIVVSNREPYLHNFVDGKVVVQRPASGLVSALEPITRACGGVWIAHGSGSADKHTVDRYDHIDVPPEKPEYTLRRVWLTQEEEEGYYYGLANEGMWPLCHIAFIRPNFRESDWQAYQAVNRKFADAVVREAKTKNPIVMVQDYHFALLPRYVREKLPDAIIITFWHIPWPNPEVFSICPWREEILAGLLSSSVLGFHTQFHCQNFMDTVDRFTESQINRDQSIIKAGGQTTLIRPYPISVAWPPEGLLDVPDKTVCRTNISRRFNLSPDMRIGVGVERLDYTKGIIDRMKGIREFFLQFPEWRKRFVFIQAVAPTRSQLPAYQAIQKETQELADSINEEFGDKNYKPILLVMRHHEPQEVFELFRAADFCIVSSLHDGMNLVAKEFVAARDDECGVLILSTFAGASKELLEALPVNPYDSAGMAQAIREALVMPEAEQKERMHLLRQMVQDNNVYYWAARILMDAAQLRNRARIEQMIADSQPEKE